MRIICVRVFWCLRLCTWYKYINDYLQYFRYLPPVPSSSSSFFIVFIKRVWLSGFVASEKIMAFLFHYILFLLSFSLHHFTNTKRRLVSATHTHTNINNKQINISTERKTLIFTLPPSSSSSSSSSSSFELK